MPFYQLPTGGSPVLGGYAAPTGGIGNDGDLFIDLANKTLYGPKAAGSWPTGVDLSQGPTGVTGSVGATGPAVTGPTGSTGGIAFTVGPTARAAVTRAASFADLISSAIANNIRGFYVEFRSPAVGVRGVVSLNDNTANERASVITSGTDPRLVVVDGGIEQANINGGTVSAGVRTRVAVRINNNDFAMSVNGGDVVTDTSGTLPTVDRIMLGRTQAGEFLNGSIARFTGWNELLSNATLQALAGQ